jgi:probable rRNA maturation factor
MRITLEIATVYKEWAKHKTINKNLIKKVTSKTLARFDNLRNVKEYNVSILLTNDEQMAGLNNKFRGNLGTTNVLSFPDIELNWQHLLEFTPNVSYMYLGDIAFGYQIISVEASSQGKTFENHFIHLIVHSVLHLIGFDHQDDESANVMENLEIDILKDFAISSPY